MLKRKLIKNIAIISSNFINEKPGGVSTYVFGRANYLSKKLNVTVYALGYDGDFISSKVNSIALGTYRDNKLFIFFIWIKLIFSIFKRKIDYIEIHNIPVGFPILFIRKCSYILHGPAILESKVEGNNIIKHSFVYVMEYITLRLSSKVNLVSPAFRKLIISQYKFLRHKSILLIKSPRISLPSVPEFSALIIRFFL